MITLPRLRKTFRRAIAGALTASPALAGCGGPGHGIADDPNFVPVPCSDDTPQWLSDLDPGDPVDFMELTHPPMSTGTPCQGASDEPGCRAQLETLRREITFTGFHTFVAADNESNGRLLATKADQITLVDSITELLAFLGEINTPLEAMLLTQAAGYNLLCKGGGARPDDDGYEVQAYRYVGCGGRDRFLLAVGRDGSVELRDSVHIKEPERGCAVGRRPAGLEGPARAGCETPGEYLAQAAELEAASVVAFRRLANELQAHGAPSRLIRAALTAAADEVRHARVTATWARALGGRPEARQVAAMGVRELGEIALENATEGCVRETFGALEGSWQALHAAAPGLRRVYARIAQDELRHAALAWRVSRWIEPRLSRAAQRRVRTARDGALHDLRRSLRRELSPAIQRVCGMPNARDAQRLLSELAAEMA